jgi:hypothetical protein
MYHPLFLLTFYHFSLGNRRTHVLKNLSFSNAADDHFFQFVICFNPITNIVREIYFDSLKVFFFFAKPTNFFASFFLMPYFFSSSAFLDILNPPSLYHSLVAFLPFFFNCIRTNFYSSLIC